MILGLTTLEAALTVVTTSLTTFGVIWVAHRQAVERRRDRAAEVSRASGTVATSDSAILWRAQEEFRNAQKQEIERLAERVAALEKALEAASTKAETDKAELEEEIRVLNAENRTLRGRVEELGRLAEDRAHRISQLEAKLERNSS